MLEADDPALAYFVRRDVLGETVDDIRILWELDEPRKLVSKQQPDGAWRYGGKRNQPPEVTDYELLETYRNLRVLVEMYGFNEQHESIQRAAEFVFSRQTAEGDIRGIIGNQYMPYYHGVILELLIKAGYSEDPRVIHGLEWLLAFRQEDGGWLVPAQTVPPKDKTFDFFAGEAVTAPQAQSSHLATGMAIRAFAAHPAYRSHSPVSEAGEFLAGRFFQADVYNDRKTKEYWFKFQFPFWWQNLLTALDSLLWFGFTREHEAIMAGGEWFIDHQDPDGLWPTGYGKGNKADRNRRWVGLAICRMLGRLA
jgi:hypothetical protein